MMTMRVINTWIGKLDLSRLPEVGIPVPKHVASDLLSASFEWNTESRSWVRKQRKIGLNQSLTYVHTCPTL